MVDSHLSMSEVARELGLTLPAVSNWRRRHPLFPSPVLVDGQERFPAGELAVWLDSRKIAKNDLMPTELPGTTYGTRFRHAMGLGVPSDNAAETLWNALVPLRGAEDAALFADLVLGLLYVAMTDDEQWNDIVVSDGSGLADFVAGAHDPGLLALRFGASAYVRELIGTPRLAEMVALIERVRRSGRGADVFEVLLDQFAAQEGRRDAVVHTPVALVRLLVELLAPAPGAAVFDPCCGSGGFLLGAATYIAEHGGRVTDASFTGYALSVRSKALAHMNLRLHEVPGFVDTVGGPAFSQYGLGRAEPRYDTVLSNPPFDLRAEREFEGRYGGLPKNRTSLAWLQYALASLGGRGRAAVVMPGGTLFREGAERELLGSTSHALVEHAECPVLVVRS